MRKIMIRSSLAACAAILWGSLAVAAPSWSGDGGESFNLSGAGGGDGSVSSFSGTAGLSATGVIGNGGGEQSSFSGAAQSDRASFGASFEDGMINVESGTLSQGETFSSSEGFVYGNAFGATGAVGVRAGFADASGGFGTEFEFESSFDDENWIPPGQRDR